MFRFPFAPLAGLMEELIILLVVIAVAWVGYKFFAERFRSSHGAAPYDRPDEGPPPSEAEVLQRLCDQLEKMERRLDNLETILGDKDEPKRPGGEA